jgi:uncharacterized protein (DUF58 family)
MMLRNQKSTPSPRVNWPAIGSAFIVWLLTVPSPLAAGGATQVASGTLVLITNACVAAACPELQVSNQASLGRLEARDEGAARQIVERVLDPHTLFCVNINPEMRVKVRQGRAAARLVPGEWNFFLARIENESGTTAPLQVGLPSPAKLPASAPWLEAEVVGRTNLPVTLSGAPLEYRLVRLRSRETGRREARISLHVGQGTQDLGFRNEVDILFDCPAPTNRLKGTIP